MLSTHLLNEFHLSSMQIRRSFWIVAIHCASKSHEWDGKSRSRFTASYTGDHFAGPLIQLRFDSIRCANDTVLRMRFVIDVFIGSKYLESFTFSNENITTKLKINVFAVERIRTSPMRQQTNSFACSFAIRCFFRFLILNVARDTTANARYESLQRARDFQ